MNQPMFERDLLYPTDSTQEPGSVHIRVYPPESDGRMPVHVEAKTPHDPMAHLDDIMVIMQADIFDRIRMDIKKSGTIYLHPLDSTDVVRVRYSENGRTHTEKMIRDHR